MDDENILIDQLEDKLIDHPDPPVPGESLDESFQKKLNERASQIGSDWANHDPRDATQSGFLKTTPVLRYVHADLGTLRSELALWFSSADYAKIGLRGLPCSAPDLSLPYLPADEDLSAYIDGLTYFALGEFDKCLSEASHVERVVANNTRLRDSPAFSPALALLRRLMQTCMEANNEKSSAHMFKLLTVVYFTVSVALDAQVAPLWILAALEKNAIAEIILQLCATCAPSPSLHTRHCLLLLWKLILLECGGSRHLKLADEYMAESYGVAEMATRKNCSKALICSQLDFVTFSEDLHDKYPLMNTRPTGPDSSTALHRDREEFMATMAYSGSISNLISIPRTNKLHSIYGSMPSQTLHIATPVPSPPSTPSDFMSGGEKIRKQYHVNQGMPYVYPLDQNHEIPEAISEANDLFHESVYESYLVKRLKLERARFLARERGISEKLSADFNPKFSVDPRFKDVKLRLKRVESLYRNTLVHLNGFVRLAVGLMKTSKIEISLDELEKELDPATSFMKKYGTHSSEFRKVFHMIYQKLELLKSKEITLKAVAATLNLLLKWFKISHVLKYQYLGSLLFDNQYLGAFVDFLSDSFNNAALQRSAAENKNLQTFDVLSSQNRLVNPKIEIPKYEFFKYCQGDLYCFDTPISLVSAVPLADLPHKPDGRNSSIVEITSFNEDFCHTLILLLNVTNKVLVKGISQRVFVFNETKPTDLLKIVLLNYIHEDLRKPILRIFKKLVPYQGRKWRGNNMDVISLIYLHSKLTLKDNWLSGKDLENDFHDSFDQEVALRSLLQFYNMEYYPEQMSFLGYERA